MPFFSKKLSVMLGKDTKTYYKKIISCLSSRYEGPWPLLRFVLDFVGALVVAVLLLSLTAMAVFEVWRHLYSR